MFALCLIPAIGFIGLGIDYYRGLSYKSRLDSAADSAALAAITTAQSYIAANSQSQVDPTLTANAIAAGKAQAAKVFPVNASTALAAVTASPTVTMTKTGQTISAQVTYTGAMKTALGGLFGVNTFSLSGVSASSLTMGKFLDFYLVLDTSGSMGLPTTDAGQTALAAINPDMKSSYPTGCVFACHFPGNQGYGLTRPSAANNYTQIDLRADSVGQAVQALLQTATKTATLPNQYRVGIYPFINHVSQAAALSSNLANANTVAGNLAQYLDSGTYSSAWGSGGTHFENLYNDMAGYVSTIGNGSGAQSPQPFIFIVTDGADNNQLYTSSGFNGSQPQLPNMSYCDSAKSAGVTISVLYTPYIPIQNPNPSFAADEDDKVNAIVPSIPGVLRNCASPGFFFTANTPQDITNAMQAMFAQALQAARLTQ